MWRWTVERRRSYRKLSVEGVAVVRWIPGRRHVEIGQGRHDPARRKLKPVVSETSTSPRPAHPHVRDDQIWRLCITSSPRSSRMAETQPAPKSAGQGSAAAELRQLLERETAKTRLRRLAVSAPE